MSSFILDTCYHKILSISCTLARKLIPNVYALKCLDHGGQSQVEPGPIKRVGQNTRAYEPR